MKQRKLIACLISVLLIVIAIFTTGCGKKDNNSSVITESKEITVTVVYADKSEKAFDIKTDAEFLGDALFEEKLIKEDEYKSGFYSYIDGVRADYNKDNAWWCVTKGGEMTNKGINDLPIADGDKFEITHTPS